jgi:hypothetical protein
MRRPILEAWCDESVEGVQMENEYSYTVLLEDMLAEIERNGQSFQKAFIKLFGHAKEQTDVNAAINDDALVGSDQPGPTYPAG